MKQGTVYYRDIPAGILTKDDSGYTFRYNESYLRDTTLPDISATLPKSSPEYRSKLHLDFSRGDLHLPRQLEQTKRASLIHSREKPVR